MLLFSDVRYSFPKIRFIWFSFLRFKWSILDKPIGRDVSVLIYMCITNDGFETRQQSAYFFFKIIYMFCCTRFDTSDMFFVHLPYLFCSNGFLKIGKRLHRSDPMVFSPLSEDCLTHKQRRFLREGRGNA